MRNTAIFFFTFCFFLFDVPVTSKKLTLDLSSADFGEQRYLMLGGLKSMAPGGTNKKKPGAEIKEPPEPMESLMEKEETLTQRIELLDEDIKTVEALREKSKKVARFLQDMSDQINEKFDNFRAKIQV